jgi:hypothetical protein
MSRLDLVRSEFAHHNLPLQALLGLLGYGERALVLAEILVAQPPLARAGAEGPAPAQHPLDLALLGLLGLRERMLAELDARGLAPASESRVPSGLGRDREASESVPEHPSPPLRTLAR